MGNVHVVHTNFGRVGIALTICGIVIQKRDFSRRGQKFELVPSILLLATLSLAFPSNSHTPPSLEDERVKVHIPDVVFWPSAGGAGYSARSIRGRFSTHLPACPAICPVVRPISHLPTHPPDKLPTHFPASSRASSRPSAGLYLSLHLGQPSQAQPSPARPKPRRGRPGPTRPARPNQAQPGPGRAQPGPANVRGVARPSQTKLRPIRAK